MRKYFLVNDLSVSEGEAPKTFSNLPADTQKRVDKPLEDLSPNQNAAFMFITDAKHCLTLIHGAPGTGKTHVVNVVTQSASECNHAWGVFTDSNAGADRFAEVSHQSNPKSGAFRYHGRDIEAAALLGLYDVYEEPPQDTVK